MWIYNYEIKKQFTRELDYSYFQNIIEKHRNEIAGLMITYPSTFGFFEKNFSRVVKSVKEVRRISIL